MYEIEEFDKQKSKVMKYIMYKKRSEYEVKNKFQNTIQEDLLCDIIDYVKEAGYLNDIEYIKKSINEFKALKSLSIKEVKYKLQQKGIKKRDLDEYISENYEEMYEYETNSAKTIVLKKENTMDKEEIQSYLIKKGYQEQIIKEVL